MKATLLLVVVSALPQSPSQADRKKPTALGTLADSMKPGEWRELQSEGFGPKLIDAGDGQHSILEWTNKATWDPTSRQFLFVGQGHYSGQKFIAYDAGTNTWKVMPKPSWDEGIGHAYNHNAVDPARGLLFYRKYWQSTVRRYDVKSGAWSDLPPDPQAPGGKAWTYGGALEYFPEADGLLHVDGSEHLAFFDARANQWKALPKQAVGSGSNFACYTPAHKTVPFGGGSGSRALYKLDPTLRITKLKDAPIDGLGYWHGGFMTVDPAGDRCLAFGADKTFYEYDVVADAWTRLDPAPAFAAFKDSIFGIIAAPATTYGVILFVKGGHSGSSLAAPAKVLVYKHSTARAKR